jgi:hypothetical protein
MSRFAKLVTFVFFLLLSCTGRVSATTYYVAANGSDANNGVTKTSPWQHAPGMPNCSATCASTTPQPGDKIILRGGDNWHFKASTAPATGGNWTWTWSGANGSPIYIGTDQTWFSGSAFARPVMNLDNPTSTSFVQSCSYDEYNFNAMYLKSVNYVTVDDVEFTGLCWTQPPTYNAATYFARTGTYITLSNSYFHGWTMVHNTPSTCCMDAGYLVTGSNSAGASHNVLTYDVFDGSDSYCSGVNACSGWGLYADAYDVDHCVFRYLSNALNSPNNVYTVHDNLFEYLYESWDGTAHGGVLEMYGDNPGQSLSVYNNVVRHTDMGITFDLWVASGGGHFFNNVLFDVGNGTNCVQLENDVPSAARSVYLTNNTLDSSTSTCQVRALSQGSNQVWNGTVFFQNNHLIALSPGSLSTMEDCSSGATCTWTDNGEEVFQSEAAANAQGYSPANSYAPTSTTGATAGAGANLAVSCLLFSVDSALCQSTSGGVSEGIGDIAIYPAISLNTRPLVGSWDAGAYIANPSASNQPNPPTGLTAAIQ